MKLCQVEFVCWLVVDGGGGGIMDNPEKQFNLEC